MAVDEPADFTPEQLPIWIDPVVGRWLLVEANTFYGGDVSKALNTTLRAVIKAQARPDDPWGFVEALARSRPRG